MPGVSRPVRRGPTGHRLPVWGVVEPCRDVSRSVGLRPRCPPRVGVHIGHGTGVGRGRQQSQGCRRQKSCALVHWMDAPRYRGGLCRRAHQAQLGVECDRAITAPTEQPGHCRPLPGTSPFRSQKMSERQKWGSDHLLVHLFAITL